MLVVAVTAQPLHFGESARRLLSLRSFLRSASSGHTCAQATEQLRALSRPKSIKFSTMAQVSFSGSTVLPTQAGAFSLSHEGVRRVRILARHDLEQSDMVMMNQVIQKWRGHCVILYRRVRSLRLHDRVSVFSHAGLGQTWMAAFIAISVACYDCPADLLLGGTEAVGADGVLWRTFHHLPQFANMRTGVVSLHPLRQSRVSSHRFLHAGGV